MINISLHQMFICHGLILALKESHSHSSTARVQSEALKITLSNITVCLAENIKHVLDKQLTKAKKINDTENYM